MQGRFVAITCGFLGWIAACGSPQQPTAASSPSVFGGQGAVVAGPKESPLPADSASSKGEAGPCAAPSPATDTTLLDDFEDNDAKLFKGFEREGWWFAATDATEGAKLSPEARMFLPEKLARVESTKDNLFAAHLKASGQKDWGAIWGTSLRWESKGIRCPLNASAFAGIRFRAKGPGAVRVSVGVPETQPSDGGGTCKAGCYDSHGKVVFLSDKWDDYLVSWDRLQQGGWGTQARFDPARIVSFSFSVRPAELPADFWIDDLAFVTAEQAAQLAAKRKAEIPDVSKPASSAASPVPAPSKGTKSR